MNRSSRPNNSSGGSRGGDSSGGGSSYSGNSNRRRFTRVARVKRCPDKVNFNYKKPDSLRQYMTSHGRIKPMRLNSLCTKHQRLLAREIKRARHIALVPFVSD
ncbi:MAG: small subunit ribosomal protein S18 [Cellvibrionaceae bacterium]|jgi:small subunit ribosomal protein S18